MKKQYRLKKAAPYREAGETLTYNDITGVYHFDRSLDNPDLEARLRPAYVESNPDWFEPVESKHKLLELLERDLERKESKEYYSSQFFDRRNGYKDAIEIVRNYLQSEPVAKEGIKEEEPYHVIFTEEETKKRASLYSILRFQAGKIQPNAGDSYYVELGKLLDKHLREERG